MSSQGKMDSLLHRHAGPSPSVPQLSVASPAFMGSTNEIFSFVDLPFILNSPPNSLTDYSTSLDLLLPPTPLSPQSLNTMQYTFQEHIMPTPPSSMLIPSLGSWVSPEKPMNQPFEISAIANTSSKKRGSRKRARSSQRAPTTVMVTNRCNFRAMVQEFTGVPAAHFSSPQLPSSQVGVFRSIPGSSALHSRDFDREFPTLSSFLMPERTLPPSNEGMIPRRAA